MSRDDCYFYFYSHCTKGSSCPFRHEEAALGKETVCSLWKEGRCFKTACPNRHMAIQKDRSQIPCYWQRQPGGCQKPHCVFSHNTSSREVVNPSDPTKEDNSIVPVPDPLDWGVLKAQMAAKQQKLGQDLGMVETPSPKVEQIVINPFEEESDQESMNGSPVKVREQQWFEEIKLENKPKLISLKKKMDVDSTIPTQSSSSAVDSMSDNQEITLSISPEKSLGIKTLEEIQRERAILSMQKRRLELAEAEIKSKMAKTEEPKVAELIGPGRRVIIKAESENVNESPVKIQQQRLEEIKSESTSKLYSPKKTVNAATREKDIRCDDSETETSKEDVRSKIKKRLGRIELREDDLSESSDDGSSNTTRVHVKDRLGFKSSVAAILNPETRKEETRILVKKNSSTPEKLLRKTITIEKIERPVTENEGNKTIAKTSASPAKKLRKTVTLEKNTDATEEKRTKSLVQTVSIKSLADIKSTKVTRRKSEDKKISHKARDSIQLYRPPAAIERPTTIVERRPVTIERKDTQKTSSSVDEKKRKLDLIKSRLSAKEEKIAPPNKISEKISLSSEQKKTNDWVAVKSFTEIMREKQERKARINLKRESNKDNIAPSEENSSQSRPALSAENGKPLAPNDGLTRKSMIVPIVFNSNDGSSDRQKEIAPSKKFENGSNNKRQKKPDPIAFSSSDDSSNASNPQCHRIKIKRSISPISFDAKVGSNKSAKDAQFKRKKFSKQSDVQSRNETSRTSVETDAAKTVEQIDCWNAVSGDADDSCNLTLSLNDEPSTDNDNIAKQCLTSQRTSLSEDRKPSSSVETKREKVVGNEEGAASYDDATYDDEDDLFTKQLDDFMVDIDAIPNEQNENNPANDDQLLLEMEELLS